MKQSGKWRAWRIAGTDFRQGDIWDVHTITETWHVESAETDGLLAIPDDIPAILGDTSGTTPNIGPVIKNIADPWGNSTGWLDGFLVRDLQWAKSGRGADVRVTYSSRYIELDAAKGMTTTCTDGTCENLANAVTLSKGLFLPCSMMPTFTSRSARLLHDGYSVNPPDNLDVSAHIGGTIKEREEQVRQIRLKLRMVLDVESLPIDGIISVVNAYMGKINSKTFMGFDAGSVVCDGPTLNHLEHEFYELVLDYTADNWFHHSQVATKGADGRPLMNGSNYQEVRWMREARGSVDFNDIFPSGDLGKSQKYQALTGKWW
jgi:hypothetical protein